MDRTQLLTSLIDIRRQRGLEIGALDRPLVTREMGPVEYVDRAPRAELQACYRGHDVDRNSIVEVDHVWGEQSLLDCVGGRRAYDYVVASHVIEHVPDVYGWLGEIASVIVDGGIAAFFVPDKRRTFDVLRPTSASGEFVDAYLRRLRRPDPRQIFNHVYDTRDLEAGPPDDAALTERAQQALALCRRAQDDGEYLDAHCWVFTPRSLLGALDLASRLGLLPFEIAALQEGGDELFLALRRLPAEMAPEAQRAGFAASLRVLALPEEATDSDHIALLRAQAQVAMARAAAIESSTIWRMTAPLRKAIGKLRRR